MPDQYDYGLWFSNTPTWLNHTYVYRRRFDLEAGKTYHFQTRNLRSWFLGPNPDPVMYLVLGNDIVAYNDDYTDFASEIIHTATTTGSYLLVIRAYTTGTSGYCDLYRGIDGTPPFLVESDVEFGGTYVRARWKAGEWFETGGLTFTTDGSGASDPCLFLIYPRHDVEPAVLRRRRRAGSPRQDRSSHRGRGHGDPRLVLPLHRGQVRAEPRGSELPRALAVTGTLGGEADRSRDDAERGGLRQRVEHPEAGARRDGPDERDKSVLELQRRLLSEAELRHDAPAPLPVSTDLMQRQGTFLRRYKSMRKSLSGLSYAERTEKLVLLKRETMGPEYSEPEDPPR